MTKFDIALLLLRSCFGLSMVAHGVNKAKGGLSGTTGWFASIGMRNPRFQAITASSTEIVAGLLLTVGLLTGPACIAFVSLMVVAIVTVHLRIGYFIFLPGGGWEYCASIIAVATSVALLGPGSMSLDHLWGLSVLGSAWVLPIGVAMSVIHLAISYRPPSGSTSS